MIAAGHEDGVLDQLKCPVCTKVPENEVYLCKNGHSICNECLANAQKCPQCNAPYHAKDGVLVRNLALESLMDLIPFGCPNNGCSAQLNRRNLRQHKETCKFWAHPFKLCEMIGFKTCDYVMNNVEVAEAIDHLKDVHAGSVSYRQGERAEINIVDFKNALASCTENAFFWEPVILEVSPGEPPLLILVKANNETGGKTISWFCIDMRAPDANAKSYSVEFSSPSKDTSVIPNLTWKTTPIEFSHAKIQLEVAPFKISTSYIADYLLKTTASNLVINISARNKIRDGENQEAMEIDTSTPTRPNEEGIAYVSKILDKSSTDHDVLVSPGPSSYSGLSVISIHSSEESESGMSSRSSEKSRTSLSLPKTSRKSFRGLKNSGMSKGPPEKSGMSLRAKSSTRSTAIFDFVSCDGCKCRPVMEVRFKCLQCINVDLCKGCYMFRKVHSKKDHIFAIIPSVEKSVLVNKLSSRGKRTILPPKVCSRASSYLDESGSDAPHCSTCDASTERGYLCLECHETVHAVCRICWDLKKGHSDHFNGIFSTAEQFSFMLGHLKNGRIRKYMDEVKREVPPTLSKRKSELYG